MKKTIFFLLLFYLIPCSLLAINGFGTFARPYHGTITTDTVWNTSSNKIYVNGDVTITAHLTINSGLIIVFLNSGADLIITGSGVLTASGTGASMIRFTADFNNNGTYGETGERWGHISFESMGSAGASIIDNCIMEYGDVSGTSLSNRYGGGIHTSFTNLTISNCIIRNNKAGWGGGIFVNKNASPVITNCSIQNNSSISSGGGLYIWSNSESIVTNCLIFNNSSTSVGGGGGIFLGELCGNVRIYNSTLINNSAAASGKNILLYLNTNPSRPSLINCIIWNPANSIAYTGQTPSPNDFINCAIQNPVSGSTTSCISLNATNTDPAGPNFNKTDGSDWSITFISTCRDSGTSTGAPATDYLGKNRIGNYDIGAYEVQYSRWTGATSTDWTTGTNWLQGVTPSTGTGDVIIPSGASNYPVQTNVSIGPGNYLIIDPKAQATFGTLNNNSTGTLWLKSDSHGVADSIASLIVDTYNQNGGTEKIELYLTGGNPGAPTLKLNKWHFISTPVSSLAVSTFAPTFTKNVVGWYDNQVSGTLTTGWIAYNGFRYSTGIIDGPTFSNLIPGNGYDYYATTDQKYTFPGQLNTSNVPMSLSFSVNDALHGFNLLGNPFSSGLNWDDIINDVYFPFPATTSKSLYFTRDNAQCSYISGVGVPAGVTGIIPPMQGFFVKTYSTGNAITIPAGARVQGNIHARYKGDVIIPLVRLTLAEGTLTDETVVRFDAAAKSGLDYDFDAPKMFLSPDILSIYSVSDGSNFAINGQPFPDTFIQIPIVVNLTAAGTHTISATQLQGLDNYSVTLTDNTTGFIADLKTTPVLTFSATTGTIADRFILKIGTIATGTEDPVTSDNTFNIYQSNTLINIQTLSDKWNGKPGSVKVLDLTGKTVTDLQNAEFSKNSLVQIPGSGLKGLYVVEIRSGVMRYVGKVVVR